MERETPVKHAFETVFYSSIENEFIKMTNIEWGKVGGKEWENFERETFQHV